MKKARNPFYVTQCSQIILIQLAVTMSFKMKKIQWQFLLQWMLTAISVLCLFFQNWNLMFFSIVNNHVTWCCVHTPELEQICEVKNFEVYRHCWNFAKVEIFEMLKSIKLPLVNLSSVKINGWKISYQQFYYQYWTEYK